MPDISFYLNGEAKTAPQGAVLSDILPDQPAGTSVALLQPSEISKTATSHLRLATSAGDIVVEMKAGCAFPLAFSDTDSLRVHFEDRNAASFGPFASAFAPAQGTVRYRRGDVILGCGGYDAKHAYLIFARREHTDDYGAAEGGAVIGRVIYGLGLMDKWAHGDRITKIEQVFSSVDASSATLTADLGAPVEDGMQIFSKICITAEGYAAEHAAIDTACADSVEHLLFCLQLNSMQIQRTASTYIRDHLQGRLDVPQERQKPRREGSVTLRTAGKSSGAIYIYTKDVPANAHHTRVGAVTKGIELARFAGKGAALAVEVTPPLLDLRGMKLADAVAAAKARGLKVMADNRDVENRVVIDQKPGTTLEVLKEGKVSLYTIDLENVVDITLDYANAPKSVDQFRRVTGLKRYTIGTMPFIYNVDDEMYLFKPEFASNINIIPENVPKARPAPDALALSNSSRPAAGMTGVRVAGGSDEFGPTGEPYSGTNIIGRVLDLDKLPHLKEGKIVYIREVFA
ncbi:MAG TPA: methanogenesis marker 3 protein [Methanocorpusculum sp.]|nr:methanogenesis marker 3 protein [Methanocorpusculum sp.]